MRAVRELAHNLTVVQGWNWDRSPGLLVLNPEFLTSVHPPWVQVSGLLFSCISSPLCSLLLALRAV